MLIIYDYTVFYTTLAAIRPDLYVGSALSPDPGGTPSFYVKGAVNQDAYDLIALSKTPINIIDNQPYSFDELESRKLQVHNIQILHPGIGLHSMTHQAQHRGIWGDIEWKTTVATESAEFYASASSIRPVTSIEPRASISVGESICFYGRSSNSRDCSFDVSATSVSCTVSGVFNDRLVRMNGNSAIGGDSGGGWSWNYRADGSVKGICGGGAVFSVADPYDEALGVTVRTQ